MHRVAKSPAQIGEEMRKRGARTYTSVAGLNRWLLAMIIAGLFAVAGACPASADTVTTFSVTGTFANGAAFLPGSTVTIDTTLGTLTASTLSISAGFNSPVNTFTQADATQTGAFGQPFIWDHADGTETVFFQPVPPDFVGFTGGTVGLVTYAGAWGFSGGSTNTVLTAVSTPEPTAVSLLGFGLLGLVGFRRTFAVRKNFCSTQKSY